MNVAIVGLSLRLPNDINNLEDLYNRLKNKIDCTSDCKLTFCILIVLPNTQQIALIKKVSTMRRIALEK